MRVRRRRGGARRAEALIKSDKRDARAHAFRPGAVTWGHNVKFEFVYYGYGLLFCKCCEILIEIPIWYFIFIIPTLLAFFTWLTWCFSPILLKAPIFFAPTAFCNFTLKSNTRYQTGYLVTFLSKSINAKASKIVGTYFTEVWDLRYHHIETHWYSVWERHERRSFKCWNLTTTQLQDYKQYDNSKCRVYTTEFS